MDFLREETKLKHAVDKYFNTAHGARWFECTPEDEALCSNPTAIEEENLFDALARLKVVICGGTINSIFTASTINDLDFYCKEGNTSEVIELLKKYFGEPTFTSENAVSFARRSTRSRKIWLS